MQSKYLLTLSLLLAASAFAGEPAKKIVVPPEEPDRWRFAIAPPGWFTGVSGDVGLNGVTTHADVNPSDLFRHADMVGAFHGEASKGRFGISADFLYMSLSDGIGADTVVKKLDVQMDYLLGDLGLRWRVLEGSRGWLDLAIGARYTNLYQKMVTQANEDQIEAASEALVDHVGERLRTAVRGALSESGIGEIIAQRLADQFLVADPRHDRGVPIAALRGRDGIKFRRMVHRIIQSRQAELTAAVQAEQDAARAGLAAARAAAQQRVATVKKEISRKIARELEGRLDGRVARTDDWFDPYIGLRARYNLTDRLYLLAKGDVGGFGVGTDFTWQAEGVLGFMVKQNMYVEAGYRALGQDYNQDGLTYDMITHGALFTMGVTF